MQWVHNLGMLLGGVVGTCVLTYLSFQDFSTLMLNQTQLRYLINPLNSLYALAEVVLLPAQIDQHIQVLGDDARILPLPVKGAHPTGDHTQPWGKQPPLLVIALGIILPLLEMRFPKHKHFIPSATGLGLAFTINGFNVVMMFLGALLATSFRLVALSNDWQ